MIEIVKHEIPSTLLDTHIDLTSGYTNTRVLSSQLVSEIMSKWPEGEPEATFTLTVVSLLPIPKSEPGVEKVIDPRPEKTSATFTITCTRKYINGEERVMVIDPESPLHTTELSILVEEIESNTLNPFKDFHSFQSYFRSMLNGSITQSQPDKKPSCARVVSLINQNALKEFRSKRSRNVANVINRDDCVRIVPATDNLCLLENINQISITQILNGAGFQIWKSLNADRPDQLLYFRNNTLDWQQIRLFLETFVQIDVIIWQPRNTNTLDIVLRISNDGKKVHVHSFEISK